MQITVLKSKIHRATVTDANLAYEGSITVDRELCRAAGIHEFERVEVYSCTTGARFATYVILGGDGEICVNGASSQQNRKVRFDLLHGAEGDAEVVHAFLAGPPVSRFRGSIDLRGPQVR
jgi:L-aspartate-alpha-decarboxylase